MWMQQSMDSAGFGNSHERNRFGNGSSRFESSGSYMGGGGSQNGGGDWKSKILESGQWLGGKVIEYGGKLARGSSHDSIPEHMAHQPRNDGRANWMADIRNSSTSYSNSSSYSGGGGGTYQNDFATERPKAYSDTGFSQSSSSIGYSSKPPQAPFRDRTNSDKSDRRSKKKPVDSKYGKKGKKKHSKRREVSDSEHSSSESELSVSESESTSSASDSGDKYRHSKAKNKGKGEKHPKRRESFSSSEEEAIDVKAKSKKTTTKPEKAPADYSFSFDPAKLPPPPPADESSGKKSKKEKKTAKSRGRRQSVESSESELSDKENHRTKKVTLKTKSNKKSSARAAEVDLLGVDLDATPVQSTASFGSAPTQATQPDIFSQPLDPLQDLAGLNFTAAYDHAQSPATVPFAVAPPTQVVNQAPLSKPVDNSQVLKKLLPENDIVDLNFLASDKKPNSSVSTEKKTLAELQREKLSEQQQQQQYQQAVLLQQQQQQAMMMGMQPPMAHAMMQQQQAMQMQMQLGQINQMNAMMHQMHIHSQPQQQQTAYSAQNQAFQLQTNQKNNGMQHFAFAPQ